MRSDRYALIQSEPRFAGVKRDLFDLPPILASEFKRVIEGPARPWSRPAGGSSSIPA